MYDAQEQISGVKHGGYSELDLLKAMAIVNIFETGKPFGDYAACSVLNDGAGISYGISQFTHRSGSLLAVVEEYFKRGGTVGRAVIENSLPLLQRKEPAVVRIAAADERFKKALRAAAVTRKIREAQLDIAFTGYLQPAIDACAGSGFVLPLSLAVVYDGITHGSYEKIRDRVRVTPLDVRSKVGMAEAVTLTNEKAWITEYVRKRDAWLASIQRLRATRYRTRFFLDQIMLGTWELELPLTVHGFRLEERHTRALTEYADEHLTLAIGPENSSHQTESATENPSTSASVPTNEPQAPSPINFETAVARFDQADRIVTTVVTRTDRAKSLWTTVLGTLWQTFWAVVGLIAGVPREVWFVVAILAAALTLFYLYRQIALGKIRETK